MHHRTIWICPLFVCPETPLLFTDQLAPNLAERSVNWMMTENGALSWKSGWELHWQGASKVNSILRSFVHWVSISMCQRGKNFPLLLSMNDCWAYIIALLSMCSIQGYWAYKIASLYMGGCCNTSDVCVMRMLSKLFNTFVICILFPKEMQHVNLTSRSW